MNGLRIPFTGIKRQYNNLRTEILDVTDEVLRSGDLMGGNYTAEFENWLARRTHNKYAITCHSGTQALEILARYHRPTSVNPPRVVVPALTYVATANAFVSAGWDLHICDTDYYGIMDVKKIPPDVSYQAVVLVGLYGANVDQHRSNWPKILIEDGAQHWLAATDAERPCNMAISFDPMKNLNAYGNGGAIVTRDRALLDFARAWTNNGKPGHGEIGSNSRMSEVDCAQMMIKTQHIDSWQQRRKDIAKYWTQRLAKTGIRCLIDRSNIDSHAFHKFVIEVDRRDGLARELERHGIETKVHYTQPLHELPAYRDYMGPNILSTASAMARRVLSLPIYPELTDLEVEYIIETVVDCYANINPELGHA